MNNTSPNENTVRDFTFAQAGPGPWVPASNSMLVQAGDASVTVEAVTLLTAAPEVLGTVPASGFDRYDTAHGYVRLVASGATTASIAASSPTPAGGGGGGGGGLTNAELRASPVSVTDPAAAVSRWGLMESASIDEGTAGATYILQYPSSTGRGLVWGVKKIVVASGVTTITYAGQANNPGVATGSAAWAARASLVYGLPQEA